MAEKGLTNIIENYCAWVEKTSKYSPPYYYSDFYKTLEEHYETANDIIKNSKYSKEDVQEFCELIGGDSKGIVCLYTSALINKIITEKDTIIIKPRVSLNCWGYNHSKGTLIVYGDVGDFTGVLVIGGEVIIKGDSRYFNCCGIHGGKVVVEGFMKTLANDITGGEIWEAGRKIYSHGPIIKTFLKNLLVEINKNG